MRPVNLKYQLFGARHSEQLTGSNSEIIARASATQNVASCSCIVDTVSQQRISDMDHYDFAEDQPCRDLVSISGDQLDDLTTPAFEADGALGHPRGGDQF